MALLVDMQNIGKSFSGVKVLDNVQFQLHSGEVHALMGENGAGKSTLMKILGGIYRKDEGKLWIKGKETHFSSPNDSMAHGIAFIHQELNLIPYLTVTENMFLGRELTVGRSGIIRWKEMKAKTKQALQKFGLDIHPDTMTGSLSIGQQQMIEIAKALSINAKILIMDEPTASLTNREIETLFKVINDLKQFGVGIIYISHRMEEIFEISDKITVLRDGRYIGTESAQDTNLETLVRMMVGREIGERYPSRKAKIGDVCLQVEKLSRRGVLKEISFFVRQGEIVAISGLMGSGRTELVRSIFGADPVDSASLSMYGKPITIKKPTDAIGHGIALVTEDRKDEGLVLGLSVRENMTLANLNQLSRWRVISQQKESSFTQEKVNQLRVKASSIEQLVRNLSGGNQQKIVIGKWLGIAPQVLILDEPTRGVDIGAKKEIYQIMNELADKGVAIIMVSSELPEVLGMSDRILVMHEGQISAEFTREEADQEKIMLVASGGV